MDSRLVAITRQRKSLSELCFRSATFYQVCNSRGRMLVSIMPDQYLMFMIIEDRRDLILCSNQFKELIVPLCDNSLSILNNSKQCFIGLQGAYVVK